MKHILEVVRTIASLISAGADDDRVALYHPVPPKIGGVMSYRKGHLFGFGVYLVQSPSMQDPAGLYRWILTITFGVWGKSFTF